MQWLHLWGPIDGGLRATSFGGLGFLLRGRRGRLALLGGVVGTGAGLGAGSGAGGRGLGGRGSAAGALGPHCLRRLDSLLLAKLSGQAALEGQGAGGEAGGTAAGWGSP